MPSDLHNRPELKIIRQALRKNATSAEALLWTMLKGKQLRGRKFRRQHSIGNYIVDFYCPSEQLVVELDGAHHLKIEGRLYDERRDEFLAGEGIRVLRLENKSVFEFPELVLEWIAGMFREDG